MMKDYQPSSLFFLGSILMYFQALVYYCGSLRSWSIGIVVFEFVYAGVCINFSC